MNAEPLVDLVIEEPAWTEALPDLAILAERAVAAALSAAGQDPADWQIALLAASDMRITALNDRFRAKPTATDVLSWPAFATLPPVAQGPRTHLGDIAIAFQTCQRDAESLGIGLKDHATHLILHGCLHLLGHDHMDPDEAAEMEGIETRALRGLGIADPHRRRDAAGPRADR
ncbi:MAG: rRNA maturation RNase YbeY [Pseudomonadota bacterium]